MNIAVSVIVPVRNGADVIERCLKSILEQSLTDIEVIVIDDGSDDNTAQLVRGIRDARVRLITQENAGQGYARNAGIDSAEGRYVAFVDADDTICPDMLETMLIRARETGADVVQCNISDVYPDGRTVTQLDKLDKTVTITNAGRYTDKYFSRCRHSYEVCNKLIRRGVITENGVRFPDTRKYFSEDLMFNLRLIPHIGKISFIAKPYYNYYQNVNSHFRSNAEERLSNVYRLFCDYMSEADDNLSRAASYTAAMVTLYNTGFCSDEAAKKMLKDKTFGKWVREALTRNCSIKHRLLLTAVTILPLDLKLKLTRKYSGRWS